MGKRSRRWFGFGDRRVQMKILGLEIRLKAAAEENEVMQKSLMLPRHGELSSNEESSKSKKFESRLEPASHSQ